MRSMDIPVVSASVPCVKTKCSQTFPPVVNISSLIVCAQHRSLVEFVQGGRRRWVCLSDTPKNRTLWITHYSNNMSIAVTCHSAEPFWID